MNTGTKEQSYDSNQNNGLKTISDNPLTIAGLAELLAGISSEQRWNYGNELDPIGEDETVLGEAPEEVKNLFTLSMQLNKLAVSGAEQAQRDFRDIMVSMMLDMGLDEPKLPVDFHHQLHRLKEASAKGDLYESIAWTALKDAFGWSCSGIGIRQNWQVVSLPPTQRSGIEVVGIGIGIGFEQF